MHSSNYTFPLMFTLGFSMQLGDLVELVRGGLSRMQRSVLSALIVIEVHAKDVIAKLVEQEVSSVNDFEWISQLRYNVCFWILLWPLLFLSLILTLLLRLVNIYHSLILCMQKCLKYWLFLGTTGQKMTCTSVLWMRSSCMDTSTLVTLDAWSSPRSLTGRHQAVWYIVSSFNWMPWTTTKHSFLALSDATWPWPELCTWSLEEHPRVQQEQERQKPLKILERLLPSRQWFSIALISWITLLWASFSKDWPGKRQSV